jgi:hypothetical protein
VGVGVGVFVGLDCGLGCGLGGAILTSLAFASASLFLFFCRACKEFIDGGRRGPEENLLYLDRFCCFAFSTAFGFSVVSAVDESAFDSVADVSEAEVDGFSVFCVDGLDVASDMPLESVVAVSSFSSIGMVGNVGCNANEPLLPVVGLRVGVCRGVCIGVFVGVGEVEVSGVEVGVLGRLSLFARGLAGSDIELKLKSAVSSSFSKLDGKKAGGEF